MTEHEVSIGEIVSIDGGFVNAYVIPSEEPESDGTIEWQSTTLVLVSLHAAGKEGVGYTYAHHAAAGIIRDLLLPLLKGKNVLDIPGLHTQLVSQVRNNGNVGLCMMAVSAVDVALWDLKCKILDLPLALLLGRTREKILAYGSGGFTSYHKAKLQRQLSRWANEGFRNVKIKIGRAPEVDVERVKFSREAIGEDVNLFVDANGAYSVKQAIEKSFSFEPYRIQWFEEPVSSDNLDGLAFIREHVQPRVNVSAGEYGYNISYFRNMLARKAVDVLQADATRCGGITGFLKAATLSEAYSIPFSSHCAAALHVHPALGLQNFYIAEYFYDHVRIESMLFDGFIPHKDGFLKPDLSKPGLGLDFKFRDAEKFKV